MNNIRYALPFSLRAATDHVTQATTTADALVNLIAGSDEAADLRRYAETLPSITLSARSMCDLELLATGAFTPLDRFMTSSDYRRVLGEMRLASGHLFPVPVTLPIPSDGDPKLDSEIALRDAKNNAVAVMRVEEIFQWDRAEYSRSVLGTNSVRHPLVTEIERWGDRFISGPVRVIKPARYYDFPELRLTPLQTRDRLAAMNASTVVAFQTRNPLHRAHEEMTRQAIDGVGGVLLLHPVVGLTKPGDVDHYSRVRTYRALVDRYYDRDSVLLALLPLAMRLAGPREALWHAIIRKNYGASHFIVGRDHASPGQDENGEPFYAPDAARRLVESFSEEIGVGVISFEEFVYVPDQGTYVERSAVAGGTKYFALSGTELRQEYLDKGRNVPEWFARREVVEILEESYPPRHRQGFCVWFTGLSGSGKSTTAEIVTDMLTRYGRRVTLLDGDVVRANLSEGLGFDKAGRDANIRRIGFVASEVVRHGGVAVCAAISPYRETRNEVRKMIGDNFFEVFVDTPLDVCERRDPKGMYAKARRGEITNFTGVDDAYEEPMSAEIKLDTISPSAEDNARSIVAYLVSRGFIRDGSNATIG